MCPIKLKCFFQFTPIVWILRLQIHMNTRSFAGIYARKLRGKSRFVWTPDTLGIIIRGFFQFHRSGRRLPLFRIAPHLRVLIREYVRDDVCWNCGLGGDVASYRFDRVCARWVRLPSLAAVLLKLQECSRFVSAVGIGMSQTSYESLRDSGLMSPMFYDVMIREISLRHSCQSVCCPSSCSSYCLAALPVVSAEPVLGYCFMCGSGLSDKTDFNFIPRCSCLNHVVGGPPPSDITVCLMCNSS